MPEKPTTETIQAPHHFSDVEKLRLAQQLADSLRNEDQIESEFASVKSEFKGRAEKAGLETGTFAQKVRDGFEMRPCVAVVDFNVPEKGRKTFRREDTGAFVREEAMTYGDQQRPLPLDDSAAANGSKLGKLDNGRTGPDAHLPEAHEQAPVAPIVESKEVPPRGFALVTEGPSQLGDLIWSDEAAQWETLHDELTGLDAIAYRGLARPVNAGAGTTPVAEALASATPEKKPRKKREPFVQPPGMVSVAGKEEHYLVLDLTGVETVAGITPLFRAAYKKAKWSDESVASIWDAANSINETDRATELKAMLRDYTYQPEPQPKP